MLRPILSIFFSFFFCRAFYIGDQDIDTTPQNRAVQPIRRPPVRYVLFMLFHPNVFTVRDRPWNFYRVFDIPDRKPDVRYRRGCLSKGLG